MSKESLNDKFIFYKVHSQFHIHHPSQQEPHSGEHHQPSSFIQNSLSCCCFARKMIERNVVTPIVEPKMVAANCESFHNLESITYDVPFPCDIYEDKAFKIKPFRASFQERLKELRNAERVYVKQAAKPLLPYIELGNQFEVFNKAGQPIFFCIDTTDYQGIVVEGVGVPFNLMLLDYDYVEIFKIDGQPGHSRVKGYSVVKRDGKQLGRISQEESFCNFTPTYNITGETGVKVTKINGYPLDGGIITQQPVKEVKPEGVPDVPEGLEALQKTQHLFIKQSGLPIEFYRTVETHYQVLDSDGEKIFMADELTDTSTRAFCRGTKPFDISFFIRSGMYRKEVMKMSGEPRSCGCGGDITLRLTKHTLGIIEQGTDCSLPYFYVRDWEGKEILHIIGPHSSTCFSFSLDKGGEFDIVSADDRQLIGKIAKYWGGKDKEIGSKIGDIWGVKFPLDMKVNHKALLLAACFLLNFQYQDVLDED